MEQSQVQGGSIDPRLGKTIFYLGGKRHVHKQQDMWKLKNKRRFCTALIDTKKLTQKDVSRISTECFCKASSHRHRPFFSSTSRNYLLNLHSFSHLSTLFIYPFLLIHFALIPNLLGSSHFGPLGVSACNHFGTPGGGRPPLHKMTPFVYRQHIPNVSEKTIGASGPSEGKITRDSERFKEELVSNWNPQIVFRDEEHTNADRLMTPRCKELLNRLAITVANYWKNKVKLRVSEGWDEDGAHGSDSLHYEGRAVDISTTDHDRSKYGMLARLAVEAGFDWVSYEGRSHIHCSVRSEKSDAARYGGCFPGDSTVFAPNGETIEMENLRVGDSILAIDAHGKVIEDKVLGFMDKQTKKNGTQHTFVKIEMEDGSIIRLTNNHLIYVLKAAQSAQSVTEDECNSRNCKEIKPLSYRNSKAPNIHTRTSFKNSRAVFAESVKVGDFVYILQNDREITEYANTSDVLVSLRVKSVSVISAKSGAYAPLTQYGNIIVDNIAASCYAVIESHEVAHWVMAPLRYYHLMVAWWRGVTTAVTDDIAQNGVHWYPHILYQIGSAILPESLMKTF